METSTANGSKPIHGNLNHRRVHFRMLKGSSFVRNEGFRFIGDFLVVRGAPRRAKGLVFKRSGLHSRDLNFCHRVRGRNYNNYKVFLARYLSNIMVRLSIDSNVTCHFPCRLCTQVNRSKRDRRFFLLSGFICPLFRVRFARNLLFFVCSIVTGMDLFFSGLLSPLLFLVRGDNVGPIAVLRKFAPFFVL